MGFIKVVGKAKREVQQDEMEITITFNVRTKETASSINKLTDECEVFLEKWKEGPFSNVEFLLEGEHIGSEVYYEKGPRVEGNRKLYVKVPYHGALRSFIYKVIEENELSAAVDFNYSFSKSEEVRKELLAEAVLDSKEKAEIIASSTKQKVIEIEEIKTNDYNDSWQEEEDAHRAKNLKVEMDCCYGLADNLQLKTIVLEEEVHVKWLIQ